MSADYSYSGPLRMLITAACLIIIVAGVKAASDILNTLLLSSLLALAILPLPEWLMRKRLSKGLSIGLTLVLVVIGGLAVLSLLGTSIASLISALPVYEARLTNLKADIDQILVSRGIDPAKLFPEDILSPASVLNIATGFLSGLASGLSSALILIVLAVLILIELEDSVDTPATPLGTTGRFLSRMNQPLLEVRKYISITGWMGLLTAAADYLLLLAMGVDYAITWAVLAFFMSFIPNIGVFLSLILPALLAFLTIGWVSAIVVIGGYLIISVIVGSLVAPRLMAKGLELKFLYIILSIVVWTWVLGPPGAILAVPLTVVLKKMMQEWIIGEQTPP